MTYHLFLCVCLLECHKDRWAAVLKAIKHLRIVSQMNVVHSETKKIHQHFFLWWNFSTSSWKISLNKLIYIITIRNNKPCDLFCITCNDNDLNEVVFCVRVCHCVAYSIGDIKADCLSGVEWDEDKVGCGGLARIKIKSSGNYRNFHTLVETLHKFYVYGNS